MDRTAATPVLDRLLLRLPYLRRSDDEEAWIREHLSKVEDFDLFFELAHDNRAAPRIASELARLGLLDVLPSAVRGRFEAEAERIRSANLARLERAAPVLRALVERGVDVVVLKGVAFAETLYGDPGYKRMNDVDLLVRRAQVPDVVAVYREHGFFPIAERVGGDPDKQLEVTHHLPPWVDRDLACMLGTQWDFRSPLLHHEFDLDAVWGRTAPLRIAGVDVRMLGPEDALHHVALHLERFRSGIRDVMDVHNLVFCHPELDWALFRTLVERAATHDDVYYALALAQATRPHPGVAETLVALEPRVRPAIRELAAFRSRSERVLVRICSRQFSTIEKLVSAFNATGVLREKLPLFVKGWGSIFWPSREDALKIAAFVEGTPSEVARARIVAPARLIGAISEEIGGLLLLGLAVKSVVDLGRAAVPFGEKEGLAAYAERLGLDLEQLRAAQQHIQ
ncbi:MAG: nucleotidyltransferase family protein [Alphaproteobacteria bacterium]|nr:nucleotidyltransferase family protein [Alphaproteobacteria bacterium]